MSPGSIIKAAGCAEGYLAGANAIKIDYSVHVAKFLHYNVSKYCVGVLA